MNRQALARLIRSLVALAMLAALPRTTEASPIALDTALSGTSLLGQLYELTVSFDLNGAAPNLVGQELYVDFTGLALLSGSYQLGSMYTPFEADLLTFDGDCAAIGCNSPSPSLGNSYLSLVSAYAPASPTGPGVLFTMQFLGMGTPWALNLVGDSDYSLLSDPLLDGSVATMPFAIVAGNTTVPLGTAIVGVSLQTQTAPPTEQVPELSTMLVMVLGFAVAGVVTHRRRTSDDEPRS